MQAQVNEYMYDMLKSNGLTGGVEENVCHAFFEFDATTAVNNESPVAIDQISEARISTCENEREDEAFLRSYSLTSE